MKGQCNCCGMVKDLRLGFCFDCADCESVIFDGTDMRDVPPPKIDGMSPSMSKLQFILKKYISINTTTKTDE